MTSTYFLKKNKKLSQLKDKRNFEDSLLAIFFQS